MSRIVSVSFWYQALIITVSLYTAKIDCFYVPSYQITQIGINTNVSSPPSQHMKYLYRISQRYVSTSPPSSSSSYSSSSGGNRKRKQVDYPVRIKKQKWKSNNRQKSSPIEIETRLQNAKDVEDRLYRALKRTRELVQSQHSNTPTLTSESLDNSYSNENMVPTFPSVRECNSALAIMGDTNDFKRALALFGQMRKSQMLVSQYNYNNDNKDLGNRIYLFPPSPSLVTYSTLMSRAVVLGKPRVALRLWRLMILQKQFFTNIKHTTSPLESTTFAEATSSFGAPIVPDIKAVNILMNVFAKMADHQSAKALMEQLYRGDVQRFDPSKHYNYIEQLKSSQSSTKQGQSLSVNKTTMNKGNDEVKYLIRVIPKMKPNIVTYNTLIDACHRAGDLDAGEQ